MSGRFILQVAVFFAIVLGAAGLLGRYLDRVFRGENSLGRRFGAPVERLVYRLAAVDPSREQGWKEYTALLLAVSLAGQLVTYALLRWNPTTPADPAGLSGMPPWLAFNTAASFASNTDWQSYGGETTLGALAQMTALVPQNFLSAAVGACVAVVMARGIARRDARTVGNAWVDLVRVHLYVLLPLSLALSLALVSQGVVQSLGEVLRWSALDGTTQSIPIGPVASQEAIEMLGTNGGGYFNANVAHPFEGPTPLAHFLELVSIFLLPAALVVMFAEHVGDRAHGRALLAAMTLLAIVAACVVFHAEASGNPSLARLGVDAALGNMEGKEARFGVADGALFSVVTTAASCGAVDSMHDSFLPVSGLVLLLDMHVGEIVFGGVGSGLYGMLVFVIVTIFLSGLMIGRTPEYLGKKIDSRDVRFASLYILVPAVLILATTSMALSASAGRAGILNTAAHDVPGTSWRPDPHGLSEVLYAYSSAVANNGSAFAGLAAYSAEHPVFHSLSMGAGMTLGRFLPMIAAMAIAGNMAAKKRAAEGPQSFPVGGSLFTALLVGTIVLVAALTFLPILAFGPIAEHLRGPG